MCSNCEAVKDALVFCPHGLPIYDVVDPNPPLKFNKCTCCGFPVFQPEATGKWCNSCTVVERADG